MIIVRKTSHIVVLYTYHNIQYHTAQYQTKYDSSDCFFLLRHFVAAAIFLCLLLTVKVTAAVGFVWMWMMLDNGPQLVSSLYGWQS